jgi:hypothetical protein
MKLTVGDLRRLVREAVVANEAKRPAGDYGEYAFATKRVRGPKVPREPDTPEEIGAYEELAGYFDLNRPVSDEVVDSLRAALASGEYSDVLREPSGTVYRGMVVTGEELQRLLKMRRQPGPSGQVEGRFRYEPVGNGVSSWTTDRKVAADYADPSKTFFTGKQLVGRYGVVLSAEASDNPGRFLVGTDGLYRLHAAVQFVKEAEALALGPVRFSGASWTAADPSKARRR